MRSRAKWASQAKVMSGQENKMVGGVKNGDPLLHHLTWLLALQKPFLALDLSFHVLKMMPALRPTPKSARQQST